VEVLVGEGANSTSQLTFQSLALQGTIKLLTKVFSGDDHDELILNTKPNDFGERAALQTPGANSP